MFKEFREFISRGNVMDLAVAVVIGTAFTAIVQSLVNNVITPVLGIFLGGVDFSNLAIQVGNASVKYGSFIQAIINFLIIAFVVFLLVQSINRLQERLTGYKKSAAEPSAEVKVLLEIRDLLKQEPRH